MTISQCFHCGGTGDQYCDTCPHMQRCLDTEGAEPKDCPPCWACKGDGHDHRDDDTRRERTTPPLDHVWWLRTTLPERKGQRCRVLARGVGGGPYNVLVQFADGVCVVGTRWCARLPEKDERQGDLFGE